jgi:hypothetical protein
LLRPGVSDDHLLAAGVIANVVGIVGELVACNQLERVPSYTFVTPFPSQATNRRLVEASWYTPCGSSRSVIVCACWLDFQIDYLERVIGNGGHEKPLAL